MTAFQSEYNPVTLAKPEATRLSLGGFLDGYEDDPETLRAVDMIDDLGEKFGFFERRYIVLARRAMLLSLENTMDGREQGDEFGTVRFDGQFKMYGAVRVGETGDTTSMHALCLAFDGARKVPSSRQLTDGDKMLFVPVHAIDEIQPKAA